MSRPSPGGPQPNFLPSQGDNAFTWDPTFLGYWNKKHARHTLVHLVLTIFTQQVAVNSRFIGMRRLAKVDPACKILELISSDVNNTHRCQNDELTLETNLLVSFVFECHCFTSCWNLVRTVNSAVSDVIGW